MTTDMFNVLTLAIDIATLAAVAVGAVVGIVKLNTWHRETNSKMDAYIRLVRKSSFDEGAKSQKESQKRKEENESH